MTATIVLVTCRCIIIEERTVAIDGVDAEIPVATIAIDWAIEIVGSYEACVLTGIEHIAQVFIAVVEQTIILFDGIVVTIHYIVHDAIAGIDEVIVNLIHIVILEWSKVQLVCHAIAQEAGMGADAAG